MKLSQIKELPESVHLPSSKSLANRWLIIQALYPNQVEVNIRDKSDDIEVLEKALQSTESQIDIGHAGTAMRFLTAYFSQKENKEIILTGSERMQQRPIKSLVSVLQQLGASIEYLKTEGYPPLKIQGTKLRSRTIEIDGTLSSQYISALMLIASQIEGGLRLKLKGKIVSRSYINLTSSVLKQAGVEVSFQDSVIEINPINGLPQNKRIEVEADWSAAAFWYCWVALTPGVPINLLGLNLESAQGDTMLVSYFEGLGVRTKSIEDGVRIYHVEMPLPSYLEINLINQPDLAQPIAVVCAIFGVDVKLNGLQTLVIKETNRLKAMKIELENFGIVSEITNESIAIKPQSLKEPKRPIKTYKDHRMAMSFSLFASKFPIEIENPSVVSKSYPKYFEHLLHL